MVVLYCRCWVQCPCSCLFLSASVRKVLIESLSNHCSPLTLSHVASLERKLTRHFQVTEFSALKQGTFLEYLVKHAQVRDSWAQPVDSLHMDKDW